MGDYIGEPPGRRPPRGRPCPRGSREYVVRRGDTLRSVAREFDTTVDELMRLNPGIRRDELFTGQRICVPSRRPCPRGSREYVVRRGDTLRSVAREFDTTVDELMRLNPGIRRDELFTGQRICVPSRRPCPRGSREYVVRRGDTLRSIAREFDTTVDELRRLNPDIRPDELFTGQRICVPDYNY